MKGKLKETMDETLIQKQHDRIKELEQINEEHRELNGTLRKENQILRENAEHNDKVVDKAKWDEMIYKTRNEKAIEYIENHNQLEKQLDGKEEYITWEERVIDKLERWVKYNKPITREQAEETIDFIFEQDNVIYEKNKERDKYKNIIDELENYLRKNIKAIYKYFDNTPFGIGDTYIEVLNKLKELKGE